MIPNLWDKIKQQGRPRYGEEVRFHWALMSGEGRSWRWSEVRRTSKERDP